MSYQAYLKEQLVDIFKNVILFDCHSLPSYILSYCDESIHDQYNLCLGVFSCLSAIQIEENALRANIHKHFTLSPNAFFYLQTSLHNCYKNIVQAQCKYCTNCHFTSKHTIQYCKCYLHNELFFSLPKNLDCSISKESIRVFLGKCNATICDYQSYYVSQLVPFFLPLTHYSPYLKAVQEITGEMDSSYNLFTCGIFFYTLWQYYQRICNHIEVCIRLHCTKQETEYERKKTIFASQMEGIEIEFMETTQTMNTLHEQKRTLHQYLTQCRGMTSTDTIELQCELYERCIATLHLAQEENRQRRESLLLEKMTLEDDCKEEYNKLQQAYISYFFSLCDETKFICTKEMLLSTLM
jgi:hypothetical protein